MSKKIQHTGGISPSLPYSPGIEYGDILFVAGQVGDAEDGSVPEDIGAQTENAILNAKRIIDSAGYSLDNVLQARVFLAKKEDFAGMNAAYRKYFGGGHNIAPTRYAVIAPPVDDRYLVEIAFIVGK